MNIIVAFILTAFMSISAFFAVPFDELEEGFAKGNATQILQTSGEKVLISIENKEGIYSKSQAIQVLKTFFTTYPPTTFKFNYKTKEKGLNSFATGNYLSVNTNFRINIKLKLYKESYKIESIVIDKE